jgi:hypothetical protein
MDTKEGCMTMIIKNKTICSAEDGGVRGNQRLNTQSGRDMKNKIRIIFHLLVLIILSGCSEIPMLQLSTPSPAFTMTPSITPTITPRPTMSIEAYSDLFPLKGPLLPLSDEHISEVRKCDIEDLEAERYPENEPSDELMNLFDPNTSCDWAVLAYAYAVRLNDGEEVPQIAKNAFGKAIAGNIGFALSTPLFYRYYYDNFTIVDAPNIADQEITDVQIVYTWGGMGDQIEYTIDISQADMEPLVNLKNTTPATLSAKTNVSKETVQALGKSLINLVPINSQFSLTTCYDNYPDWKMTLTLQDGSTVELGTNESNMIYIGGPWQVNIDGQDYVQFSIEFVKAIDALIQELGLPYGEPMAMTCNISEVFEQAYP